MRILVVVDGMYPHRGGAEMQARLLARSLAAIGHTVSVVAPRLRADQSPSEIIDGIEVARIVYPRIRLVGALVLCVRFAAFLLVRRRSLDAIHVHMAQNLAAVAGLLRPLLRATVTVKISGAWEFDGGVLDPTGPRGLRWLNGLIRQVDHIQCISRETEVRVCGAGYPASMVRRIPNAVDTRRFRPRVSAAPGSRRVVFAGRLVPVKGVHHLIRAWARLRPGSAVLVIAGDGPQREELERLATDLGVSATVTFVGHQDDVPALLAGACLYVQPSEMEGLSNAVLEAMSAGLPVIATRVSGSEELVVEGVNGLLVSPRDDRQLADAIQRILDDPALGCSLGHGARSFVEERFSVESVLASLVDTYASPRAA